MGTHMKRRSRRKSRKRRGGLRPSDVKECKKAGVAWDKCAAHIAKAKVEAVKAAAATPKLATTVAQQAALKKIAPQLSHLHKKSTAGVALAKQGVEDIQTRKKLAEMRVRSDSSGGKRKRRTKRRRKSRKSKKSRRKSRKSKRRRKSKKRRSRRRR